MKYQIIYADPPWSYNQGMQHVKPENHYDVMNFEDILNLNVKQVVDKKGCLLFMWTTSAFMEAAIQVGNKWGFKYKSVAFVWVKHHGNPGPWTFQKTEFVLLFTKGSRPKPKGSTKEHQVLFTSKDKIHSRKPIEIIERIEKIAGEGKKCLEMFARTKREGWDVFGNEVDDSIKIEIIGK